MPSPFPGMDPYIEATPNEWAGSHNAMALKIAGSLNQSLPPGFRARCEESQLVEVLSFDDWGEPTDQYRIIPDVSTGRRSESRDSPSVAVAGVGGDVSGEVRTIWQSEPTRSLFVRIVAADAEPVCMIELLSPSNKRAGVDRQTYLREKQDLLASNVSLVEIDLLLRGRRACEPYEEAAVRYGTTPSTPYVVAAYPACEQSPVATARCRPIRLDETLSTINVPVTETVGSVPVDLQGCFTAVYEELRFVSAFDYRAMVSIGLTDELRR